MSIGFQSRFLNKLKEKEKEDKPVPIETEKKQATEGLEDVNSNEESECIITEINNKDSINNHNTLMHNNSSINKSNSFANNDSRTGFIKQEKKNVFKTLNVKPEAVQTEKNPHEQKNNLITERSISSADSQLDSMSKHSGGVTTKPLNLSARRNTNPNTNIHKKQLSLEAQPSKVKSFAEDNLLVEKLGSNNNKLDLEQKNDDRKLTKRDKICDTDTEDEGSDFEKEVKWIILPDNTYKRSFDILIALIIIYSAIVLPYKIAFIDIEIPSDVITDNLFNIILFIDIILNFFSAYVDNEDNVVKNRRKIIWIYLEGWFLVDLIAVLPVSYISSTSSTSQYNALARLSRIPKLYRLIRLTKLFRMVKILKKGNVNKVTKFFLEKLKVNANIERLIYFILAFLLLNHLAACIWFFVAKLQDLNPDCWVTRLGYIDASNVEIYIVSFYWTLTTVTTVGYGDINAGTTIERIYNLFIMSFGVLMYSFAIGSLSSIVSTLDAKTAEMNQKLQILSSIKKEFSLDQEIYEKVRKVIKYDLSRNQKDKMNFLQELPNKLRIELSQIMHDSVIQKMYFFKDQPSDFIAYVAPLLKPVKFSQNDYLYKEGDMIDEMYFVSKGTVSFCLGKTYLDKEIKEIKKHNNFGEIEMCLNEKLSFNIRVKSRNCELFVLKKNDFLRLSVNFKEFIEKFLQRSLMIYLRFNDENKKITKQIEEQNKIAQGMIKTNNKGKIEELEMIDEKEEEEGSEVYDIFGDHYESENSRSASENNKSQAESENEEQDSINKESDSARKEIPKSTTGLQKTLSQNSKKNSKLNNSISSKGNQVNINNNSELIQMFNAGRLSAGKNVNEKEQSNKKSLNSQSPINNEIDDKGEPSDNVENLKNQMNKKFIKKVEKIISFMEKNNLEMDTNPDSPNNPLVLLKKLKNVQNLSERNEIIDKIESIVTDIFNKNDKK